MYVDLRTPGLRLPRGRAHALARHVSAAFRSLSDGVARVVVRLTPAEGAATARDCAIEVHLRDGTVEVVHERRRRLAGVLARALQRAWQRAWWRLQGAGRG